MSSVPTSPEAFFTEYVPARVARLGGALSGRSSPGSVLFDVPGVGRWSLRLREGKLEVGQETTNHLLTIAVTESDFVPIIVASAERVPRFPPERQMMAARILTLDADRAALMSNVSGSLGVALADGDQTRRLLIAPPKAVIDIDHPSCEVACAIDDFWSLQAGTANPFELLMNGRLKLGGDAQIAMALSGVFA